MFKRILDAILNRIPQPTVETRIQVLQREQCKVSIGEWRSDTGLVDMAKIVLNKPETKLMLDCLRNEHPGTAFLPSGTSASDRAAQQSLAEGYTMAIKAFEALGVERKKVEMPVPTYGAEVPEGVDANE